MEITNVVAKQLYETLKNLSQTRVKLEEKEFKEYCEMVNYINSLPRDTAVVDNVLIDKVFVACIFEQFILPNEVKLSGAWTERDLLTRVKHNEVRKAAFSASKFNSLTRAINGTFRLSDETGKSLSDLRKNETVANVVKRTMKDGKCYNEGTYFIPLEIDFLAYEDYAYAMDSTEMTKLAFAEYVKSSSK